MLVKNSLVLNNKFLLRCGSIILFISAIFGFYNQVFAGDVNRYQITQDVSLLSHIDGNKKHAIHLKLGSMTIFISEKIIFTKD
ncbi:MAG: hypothetical protein ACHBN1_34755 [Heteroscytonema crispum UTEX LB 1556]